MRRRTIGPASCWLTHSASAGSSRRRMWTLTAGATACAPRTAMAAFLARLIGPALPVARSRLVRARPCGRGGQGPKPRGAHEPAMHVRRADKRGAVNGLQVAAVTDRCTTVRCGRGQPGNRGAWVPSRPGTHPAGPRRATSEQGTHPAPPQAAPRPPVTTPARCGARFPAASALRPRRGPCSSLGP